MMIKEYQVKQLFQKHGVPLLKGGIAYTPEEAKGVAEEIGGNGWVVKAQVEDGSRTAGYFLEQGKPGMSGICWANSPQMAEGLADRMLGHRLFFSENDKKGYDVQRVYVEEACLGKREYKLSIRIDLVSQKLILTGSCEEDGLHSYELKGLSLSVALLNKMMKDLHVKTKSIPQMKQLLKQMMSIFESYAAIAVEFDPIIETNEGLIVLDGRILFHDYSLFRFPEIEAMREIEVGYEREALAQKYQFRYIKLGGNIACLVNGIGLGQATIDLIHQNGGKVACLLDIGAEPSRDAVARALRLALSDPDIDGVLVNIFGGITRCDVIVQGLLAAAHEIFAGLPVVIRMDGTNAHIGRRLLFESRLPFTVVKKMQEAVCEIIRQVKEID